MACIHGSLVSRVREHFHACPVREDSHALSVRKDSRAVSTKLGKSVRATMGQNTFSPPSRVNTILPAFGHF